MTTKKELEKDKVNLKNKINELQDKIYSLNREINGLSEKNSLLESMNNSLSDESKRKSDLLDLVVEILSGEAPNESKSLVLLDLFPEAIELKERKNKQHNTYLRRF